MRPLEVWGGHECTVNRVGHAWRDQTVLTGHETRPEDLEMFAGLGLRALRYPVLWERTERRQGAYDWAWADDRLSRIRALGMRPIVGLLHHGSGPAWTDLLDPDFPARVAEYAGRVAARYPWVQDWTPINEPLTTARFSALYGHWYPHRRDEGAFWRALLNQIDAVRLSMQAIRRVNPHARLVQTEDFGTVWATAPCRSQARFENRRRYMTFDLLTGRVGPGHPLYTHLADLGLGGALARIGANPSPPDVVGLNHYITSDRFLDHRLDHYPRHTHGGNGALAYADVEAVRVLAERPCGWAGNLRRLWRRYQIPIAITECHLGCDEEGQSAWLRQAWNAAELARAGGVDVKALTVWSLVGAVDWDSLLVEPRGNYEAGVFRVADGGIQPTGVVETVRALADGRPAFPERSEGWWTRPERLLYPPHPEQAGNVRHPTYVNKINEMELT